MPPEYGSPVLGQAESPPDEKKPIIDKSSLLASVGVVVEFYDFMLFGYLATVWTKEFFPSDNEVLAQVLVWSTFAVGMLMRPIGGIFFGAFGTRFGRKAALRLSVVLMCVPMLVTAVIPEYRSVGLIAPILLVAMRMIQGFSVGGEYSGSVVYLCEHSPPRNRATVAAVAAGASGVGAMLAALVVLLLQSVMAEDQFISWGWRLSYVFGGLLVVIAIFMRSHMQESAYFAEAEAAGVIPKAPLRTAFREEWRTMLVAVLISGYAVASFFFILNYLPSFLETLGGHGPVEVLILATVLSAVYGVAQPFFGIIADRTGRKPSMIIGALVTAVMAFPVFILVGNPQVWELYLGSFMLLIPTLFYWAGFSPAVVEIFSAHNRFSAVGISYNIGAGVFGGTVGVIVTLLSNWTNPVIGPALYLIPFSLIVLIVCMRLPETGFTALPDDVRSPDPQSLTEQTR